jgi:hypothetical protein
MTGAGTVPLCPDKETVLSYIRGIVHMNRSVPEGQCRFFPAEHHQYIGNFLKRYFIVLLNGAQVLFFLQLTLFFARGMLVL